MNKPMSQQKNTLKGTEYIYVLHSINKIKNFMQIESTRTLIDLFGKKTGDNQLKEELTQHLLAKARGYDFQ